MKHCSIDWSQHWKGTYVDAFVGGDLEEAREICEYYVEKWRYNPNRLECSLVTDLYLLMGEVLDETG